MLNGKDLSKEQWESHVRAAMKYEGSNQEYCRLHQLKSSTLSGHKRRMGLASKSPKKSEFIQIVSKKSKTIDPVWLSEFLKALHS
ncbi:MAG: hypothetical protein CL678_01500 [Bdellovibrionaceae bacterium]|nr:hypothetical protein [Pseudobdellovibrionaceae bacterium]